MSLEPAPSRSPSLLAMDQTWGHQPDLQERLETILKSCLEATKAFPRRAIRKLLSYLRRLIAYLRKLRSVFSPPAPPPPPPPTHIDLMRFPTDLRMLIYEQILGDVHVLEHEQFHPRVAPDFAFLQTNRLVYREARMLYYDVHVFEFESVDEIVRLSLPQRQRIKNVKLWFSFGLADKDLSRWRSVCAAVSGLGSVRSLEIRWRVWWDKYENLTMAPELRAAWVQGMSALRSMRGVQMVRGRVRTQIREVAGEEAGDFVLRWVGLDGLEEAFWTVQVERVRTVYEEHPEPEGVW